MKPVSLSIFEICDYATMSQDNKLSIIGIFDQVYVRGFPAQHSRMFIVGVANGEANSVHKLMFKIRNIVGENVLPNIELNVKLSPNGKTNVIAEVNNVPLSGPGTYIIECLEDNTVIQRKELVVQLQGVQPMRPETKKLPN